MQPHCRLVFSMLFGSRSFLISHRYQHPTDEHHEFGHRWTEFVRISIHHSQNRTMRKASTTVFITTFHIKPLAYIVQSSSLGVEATPVDENAFLSA